MTLFLSPEEPPLPSSPFAGQSVCDVAGCRMRPGFSGPRFEEDIWDMVEVEGLPRSFRRSRRIFNFTKIRNPLWRPLAKEYLLALMAPTHERVRGLPRAYRVLKTLQTCRQRFEYLRNWLNWLTGRGITSLADVTQRDCDAFLLTHSTIHDEDGNDLREASDGHRLMSVLAPQDLAFYGELFGTDRYAPGFIPWKGVPAFAVIGATHPLGNKTPPARAEMVRPVLAAALFITQTLAPLLVAELRRAEAFANTPRTTSTKGLVQAFERTIRAHVEAGEPFERVDDGTIRAKAHKGWCLDDPLLPLNLRALCLESGADVPGRGDWLTPGGEMPWLRPMLEEAVARVGFALPRGRNAASIARADGHGEVPWTLPLFKPDWVRLVDIARTACAVVIFALSGMRPCELAELPVDCQQPLDEADHGRVRHRLKSKLIKGKGLGGVWDEWVVVADAYDAAGIARDLAGPKATHLFPSELDFAERWKIFRGWVNGPEGTRLGLAPIPMDRMNPRILRRTLAVELAHRPGGLLAAKIQLKHLSVVTTEGYAHRPGGAQSKFLAEVGNEEQDRNLTLTLQAFRDYQDGKLPAGPGARNLIDFFQHVDAALDEDTSALQVKQSDQEVLNLLAKRAATLHLGIANYCWFIDPDKALCLKLAGATDRREPLAGMCDSTRCPQATHHPCHRPVWASAAEHHQVFIGKISRRQKGERQRLQTELDRAEHVLTQIDTAAA